MNVFPILFLQAEAVLVQSFWQTTTGTAIIVAAISGIVAPLLTSWIQTKREEWRKKNKLVGHLTDAQLKLEHEERQEVRAERDRVHQREIELYQRQLNEKDEEIKEHEERYGRIIVESKVMEYESRGRAHRYGNECNRLQAHIWRLNLLLTQQQVTVPDFEFRTYPDIMEGLDEEVLEYRKKIVQGSKANGGATANPPDATPPAPNFSPTEENK